MGTKVILTGFIEVPRADLESVKAELATHIELTRNESGCLAFAVEEDPKQECRFIVYEKFVNQNAFAAHQHRVKKSRWAEITKNVQRKYQLQYL